MEAFWSYEYVVAGIVSSVLCLVLIILDYIFGSYAHKLTEWEYPRTQENFEFVRTQDQIKLTSKRPLYIELIINLALKRSIKTLS